MLQEAILAFLMDYEFQIRFSHSYLSTLVHLQYTVNFQFSYKNTYLGRSDGQTLKAIKFCCRILYSIAERVTAVDCRSDWRPIKFLKIVDSKQTALE
eukprot:COSAG05_NODE_68_length_22188_cov_8.265019_2_plen_97_part_00